MAGQIVANEGENCDKIMLVRAGEFDVVKAASGVQMVRQEEIKREEDQVRKMMDMER